MLDKNFFKSKGLITTGFHLPYNPDLKEKARDLRKNLTEAERKLWFRYLRGFKHPVLRQKPIDNYIVDFYCPALGLVIEIDGDSNYTDEGKVYDEKRSRTLKSYGLKILRFTNIDVLKNLEGVCQRIEELLVTLKKSP